MSNNYEIVYGDSVSGETQIKVNNKYVTIESLFTEVTYTIGDKEYCVLKNCYTSVINDDFYYRQYPIKYVMRHKTDKKMYRVWVRKYDYVDVTEDHSFISYKNNIFINTKPTDESLTIVYDSWWLTKPDNIHLKKSDMLIIIPTRVEQIETPEYVYDIEVSDVHRFFGNHILLHNTDSVAVSNVPSIEDGVRLEGKVNDALLEWARKHGVKDEFAPVVKFEKYFKKMFFKKRTGGDGAAKKKYVGHLIWKDGKDKDEISYTGIETKRSDTAPITKECMENFFQKVLLDGKPDEAVTAVKKTFNDVKTGRVSCHAIAIPKAVHSKTVVNPHTKGMAAGTTLMGIRFDASKKPKLLYCKSPCTEICIDDNTDERIVREKITIDYDKMADRTIAQKMRSLIESLGYDWNESAHGQTKLNFGDKV